MSLRSDTRQEARRQHFTTIPAHDAAFFLKQPWHGGRPGDCPQTLKPYTDSLTLTPAPHASVLHCR
ncbi:hypothetical protein E2C01_004582 [Portunus trituberculatus]|uniref:Uncharacterized protein n=1 Tax=Portunus trituberculatus TaxID=210409 RepID=A0A5B7CQ31_PORTR|nr:hypothetical protein [Portunus trituberculatus]